MSEKTAVEVLPPDRAEGAAGKSNLPRVANLETSKVQRVALLQGVASQLHEEFEAYGKLENEAAYRAIRIGILLLKARESLKHGEFGPWLEENVVEVRRRQAFNFINLAQAFIDKNQIEQQKAYLLCEAKSEHTIKAEPKVQKIVQMVFDFIGEKSQAELFAEYGINVREKKSLGGANHLHQFLKENYPDHPEYIKMSLRELPKEVKKAWEKHLRETANIPSEQFNRVTYQAVWRNMIRSLRENGLEKKTYSYLDRRELEELHGTLLDVKKEISEALKK